MPRTIKIGEFADGTPMTTQVPTLAEYFYGDAAVGCDRHEANIDDVQTANLEERYAELVEWNADPLRHDDPRCGGQEDGEGSMCFWDNLAELGDELARRGR